MKKKILVLMVAFSMIVLALQGCAAPAAPQEGKSAEPAAPQENAQNEPAASQENTPSENTDTGQKKPFKAALVESTANIFFDLIDSGVRDTVEANGGTLMRSVSEINLQRELAFIEDYIQQGIDVLFLTVADVTGSSEAIRKCNEAGIPVFCLVSEPRGENAEIVTYCKSDDKQSGFDVAEYLFKQIDYDGEVIIINGPQISDVIDRVEGFKEAIDKYPNIKLVGEAIAPEHSISGVTKTVDNLMQAHPNTKVILTYCGFGLPGAYASLEVLGKTQSVLVGGIDGLPEECALLTEGKVLGATIGQYPYEFGVEIVKSYLKWRDDPNADIPKWTKVPTVILTKDNAASFDGFSEEKNRYK